MGPEAKLQAACRKWAKANGWWCCKFSSPSTRGVPDFVFIKDGIAAFIEFKAPGAKPTPLQLHTMEEMAAHGARIAVVDNFDVFKGLLSGLA